MFTINDLNRINEELQPLKILADRERQSVYGLSGKIYTPHIDTHTEVSLKKAQILAELKKVGVLPITNVESISAKLLLLHKKTKNHSIVEYEGNQYVCRYAPLKLSKSGKSVQKWAKYWLKKLPDGEIDHQWESIVREIWPEYFSIRNLDI